MATLNLNTLLTGQSTGGTWSLVSSPPVVTGCVINFGWNSNFGIFTYPDNCLCPGDYVFQYTVFCNGNPVDTENVTVHVENTQDMTISPAVIPVECGESGTLEEISFVTFPKCTGVYTTYTADVTISGPGGYLVTFPGAFIIPNNAYPITVPYIGTPGDYCITLTPTGVYANQICEYTECFNIPEGTDACAGICLSPSSCTNVLNTFGYDLTLLFDGATVPPGATITYTFVSGPTTPTIAGSIATFSPSSIGTYTFKKKISFTEPNGAVRSVEINCTLLVTNPESCTISGKIRNTVNQGTPQFTFEPHTDEIFFSGNAECYITQNCPSNGITEISNYPITNASSTFMVECRTSLILCRNRYIKEIVLSNAAGGTVTVTINSSIYDGTMGTANTIISQINAAMAAQVDPLNGVSNSVYADTPTLLSETLCTTPPGQCIGSFTGGQPTMQFLLWSRVKHNPTGTWIGWEAGVSTIVETCGVSNWTQTKNYGAPRKQGTALFNCSYTYDPMVGSCTINMQGESTLAQMQAAVLNLSTTWKYIGYTVNSIIDLINVTGSSNTCSLCQ